MRICDHMCDRIFGQNLHITYFSAYNSIFKIAYVKSMLHIQKFAHIPHISAYAIAFFLSNVVLRPLNIFGGKQLLVFTIRHCIN